MKGASERPQGLRERKRRETSERIIEKGLKLFVKNGYEAATLDAIAEAAGISRRTFFYYFKSKEDVLLAAHDSGFREALRPAMLDELPDQAPLDAVQKCLVKLASRYETKESIVFDRLMESTEERIPKRGETQRNRILDQEPDNADSNQPAQRLELHSDCGE